MKKFISCFLVPAVVCLLGAVASACSDDGGGDIIITDYSPLEVEFKIVDAEGKDLVADNGPLYGTDMSLTVDGKRYDIVWDFEPSFGLDSAEPKSRYYLPYDYGFVYFKYYNGTRSLYYGEIDGACDQDLRMTLTLADGTGHDIRMMRKHQRKGFKYYASLDGKEIKFDGCILHVTIVK